MKSDNSKVKAYVYNEHTLGYIRNYSNTESMVFECLNGLGTRGGMSILEGWTYVRANEVRPATLKDFNTFRVSYSESTYEVEQADNVQKINVAINLIKVKSHKDGTPIWQAVHNDEELKEKMIELKEEGYNPTIDHVETAKYIAGLKK